MFSKLSPASLWTLFLALAWFTSSPYAFAHDRPDNGGRLTREEALALAFPGCKVERGTAYLDKSQVKRVATLSKVKFKSTVVYPYRATKQGKWIGTAYFDTHRVRTKRETLMVVVKPDGRLGRVEVLVFAEPKEYIPRPKWYQQFDGHKLTDQLYVNRKVRGVTGATLTSTVTTQCTRRVLALDQVLRETKSAKQRKTPKPAPTLQ